MDSQQWVSSPKHASWLKKNIPRYVWLVNGRDSIFFDLVRVAKWWKTCVDLCVNLIFYLFIYLQTSPRTIWQERFWPKWAKVVASQFKNTQGRSNGVASSPKFLTCVYFRVRLTMLELHSFGEKNLSSLFSYIFVFSRSILRKALTSEKVHKLKAFLTGSNPPKKSNKPSAGLFKARLS